MKPAHRVGLHLVNSTAICLFLVAFLNRSYPSVGHDYRYFIPMLLDTHLHYKINGFSIQWYTASFGGGLPAYPNPQHIQFSLPQVLTLLLDPWNASLVSTLLFALVGYSSMSWFISRTLSLGGQAGSLAGLLFTFNGFFIEHLAAGHLGYQAYPLLSLFAIFLFHTSLPEWIAILGVALALALMLNQAGFYLVVIGTLSLLILIPLVFLIFPRRFSYGRVLRVGVAGMAAAALLGASKLYAVFSFLRFFPREITDHYDVSLMQGIFGIFLQLLGAMNLASIGSLVGIDSDWLIGLMVKITGAPYGYWEFDMSLSPAVFVLFLLGLVTWLRQRRRQINFFRLPGSWVNFSLLVVFIWLAVEFTLAKGLVYPFLRTLPVVNALHVNPRFAAVFILPLVTASVVIFHRILQPLHKKGSLRLLLVVNLTAQFFVCTYLFLDPDLQDRSYDLAGSMQVYRMIQAGSDMTVTGAASGLGNTDALLQHLSNLEPYEPIFGYILQEFHPQVIPGSAWQVDDDWYNFTNPAGYVFPEINDTRLFERFRVGDEAALQAFLSHQRPRFSLPLLQQVLDWVSGVSFVLSVLAIAGFLAWRGWFCIQQRRLNAWD